MTRFTIGINLGFAINRFPEPEIWARIVREEFGLQEVQFVADLLNPFWPEDVVTAQREAVLEATAKYGIRVQSTFTSAFTRVNHLMHPDPMQRAAWLKWFERYFAISAAFGAEASGSHFGIMSVTDESDPVLREERRQDAIRGWQHLTRVGRDLGLKYLLFEPMSCPRENAWTVEETLELRDAVNADAAIPMEVCLDLGHAPHPDQRDPVVWIRGTGAVSPVIHLQQTELGHSRHWPFTAEYNAIGVVQPDRMLDELAATGRDEFHLFLEISHRERWPDDTKVIADLAESAQCWIDAIAQFESRQTSVCAP